jgi:hypothetical protein
MSPLLAIEAADRYVGGAYLVFLLLLLIYVAIMATRLQRIQSDLSELAQLAEERGSSRRRQAPSPTSEVGVSDS